MSKRRKAQDTTAGDDAAPGKQITHLRFRLDARAGAPEYQTDVVYDDGSEETFTGDDAVDALDGVREGIEAHRIAQDDTDQGDGSGAE